MHFTSSLLALGLASYASAHIEMVMPVPFGKSTLDNSPLKGDGSDFPCKQRTGVYNVEGASNPMPLGSTQPLNFIGTAVHGGGSCQISITYDAAPTKDSVWKVIHSIEGGCPMKGVTGNNGNNADTPVPDTYHFTVPTGLPTGTAVLAWTWFNKVGNREMYMNCAPIEITGGNSKRMERNANGELVARDADMIKKRSQATYDALPDMFTANIGNGCGTKADTDLLFPQPGDSVEQLGLATKDALVAPTGSCQAAGAGGSGGSGSSADAPAPTQPPVASATDVPGGVFVTVAPGESANNAPVATSAPVASVPAATSAAATSAAATTDAAAPTPTPTIISTGSSSGSGESSANASVPDTAGPVTGGSAVAAGTACPDQEGSWNCIDGNSFQRCASGQWSVIMTVASGTTCEAGISQAIKIVNSSKPKRSIRFSNEHVRRHIMRSS